MESYQLRHFRQVLGRRYEFRAFLGRGAFASVYLVQNLKLKRREALKILADTFEPDSTARFVAEARLVASLDHPNIVQVYDYGQVEGLIWYSMQYVEGPMLRDEMWVRKRFDPISAVRVAIPLLGALEASHRRGIVHRDIKPSNIILNRDGRPYLMDFGIAKASDSHLKTMTGSVLGTPAFMAPEQAEGKPLDGRADLYALGLVLYQMLAGRSPFDTQEPVQLLLLRLREDPPRLATFVPEIDPELEAILMKTLARDRDARFASARELERHLAAFLGDASELPPFTLMAPVFDLLPLEQEIVPERGGASGVTVALEAPPTQGTSSSAGSARRRLRGLARGELAVVALILTAVLLGTWFLRSRTEVAPESTESAVAGSLKAPALRDREETEALPVPAAVEPKPAQAVAAGAPTVARPSPPAEPSRQSAPAPAATVAAPPAPAMPRRAIRPPLLVEEAKPSLSGDAVALCAGVAIVVSIQVGEAGWPLKVRSLNAGPSDCRASAEAAALNYRFKPAQDVEGQPVPGTVTLSIQFGDVQ